MIVFAVIIVGFALPLMLFAPKPESLRTVPQTGLKHRIRTCAGTFLLGVLLIFAAIISFNQFFEIDPVFLPIIALSRYGVFEKGFVFQLATSNLFHFDLFHLVTNLSALLLVSVYERRVGWRRFFAVYFLSAVIASIGELIWLRRYEVSIGASAGLCGLAAAYFLDYRDLSRFDWVKGLVMVLLIIGVYSFLGPTPKRTLEMGVDHAAHILGALAGGVYVYFVAPRPVQACA